MHILADRGRAGAIDTHVVGTFLQFNEDSSASTDTLTRELGAGLDRRLLLDVGVQLLAIINLFVRRSASHKP